MNKNLLSLFVMAVLLLFCYTATKAEPFSDEKYSIHLESRVLIPEQESTAELNDKLTILRDQHVLIQLDHLPSDAEKASLENNGIKLVAHIPYYAWYAKLSAQSILPSSGIRYISAIQPSDKISQHINDDGIAERGVIDENTAGVHVIFFSDVTLQEIQSIITEYGYGENIFGDVWEITLHPERLLEFAKQDCVQWIENVPPEKIAHLSNVRSVIHANEVQISPYNLHGNGYVAAMWDAGIAYAHTDYSSRLTDADGTGSHWHATMVAGAMAGNGSRSYFCGGYSAQWRGIATQADIISYDWDDAVTEHNSAKNTYHADVSQNSWGWDSCQPGHCTEFGDYDSYSRSYDQIVRGDLYSGYITIVTSAGNQGECDYCSGYLPHFPYGTVTGPMGTSKNALSISGTITNNNTFWSESSRGPTDDGRIKPDLSAPACKLYSNMIISTYIDNCYAMACGTSMSSPVVSGAVILMYEQYNEFYSTDPLPSTIRAVLYHTAIDYGNDGPDYQYGYGRIHVKDAIDLIIDDNGQNLKIVEDQLYNSQTDQFQVYVEPGQTELKITVAWDDKAAYGGSGVKLLNNLNLLLISPSSSNYYPWTLDWNSPSSPATTGIDTRNNMEQVYVSNPESGVWTVQVTGSYIPYAPQQYSLIGDFTENTGTIGGNVTDAVTADPIEGALVRALHTAVSDVTNSNGSYTLAGLEAGVYDISFSHDDYESLTENDIEVIVGETTRLYVEMTPISGCYIRRLMLQVIVYSSAAISHIWFLILSAQVILLNGALKRHRPLRRY